MCEVLVECEGDDPDTCLVECGDAVAGAGECEDLYLDFLWCASALSCEEFDELQAAEGDYPCQTEHLAMLMCMEP